MTTQPPPQLEAEVNELLTHYPPDKKRSAMVMVLHAIQNHLGHVPDEMIEWAAAKLECQPIHVYECVTFYPMFRRQPVGRYVIKVCRTLSCELAGGHELAEHIKKRLGIGMDGTTPDKKFTLAWVECLADCGRGPCVMINDEHHEHVTKEKLDQLVATLT